jgi:hypothetical protein
LNEFRKIKKIVHSQMDFHLCFDRFLSGSASALVALEWAAMRGQNNWIIWLPLGGLLIGLGYHYGKKL